MPFHGPALPPRTSSRQWLAVCKRHEAQLSTRLLAPVDTGVGERGIGKTVLQQSPHLQTSAVSPIVRHTRQLETRDMDIFKDKLPAGWAYALKPSLLEAAITDAGMRLPVSLYQRYKVWAADAPTLSAKFYPPGSYMGKDNGRFSVTSAAIESDERNVQLDFAERVFIPALVKWMTSIETLPPDSTVKREEQSFTCEGSLSALSKRPLALISKGQRRPKRA